MFSSSYQDILVISHSSSREMLSDPIADTVQPVLRTDPINMVEMMGVGVDLEKNGDHVAVEICWQGLGRVTTFRQGRRDCLFHLVEYGLQHPQAHLPTSLLLLLYKVSDFSRGHLRPTSTEAELPLLGRRQEFLYCCCVPSESHGLS